MSAPGRVGRPGDDGVLLLFVLICVPSPPAFSLLCTLPTLRLCSYCRRMHSCPTALYQMKAIVTLLWYVSWFVVYGAACRIARMAWGREPWRSSFAHQNVRLGGHGNDDMPGLQGVTRHLRDESMPCAVYVSLDGALVCFGLGRLNLTSAPYYPQRLSLVRADVTAGTERHRLCNRRCWVPARN